MLRRSHLATAIWVLCDIAAFVHGQNLLVTPNQGRIGSRIYFIIQSQQPTWQFNDSTRIEWTGTHIYCPPGGGAGVFQDVTVQFSAEEVLLNGPYEARIVLGTGASPQFGKVQFFAAPGCFDGTYTITTAPLCPADLNGSRAVDYGDVSIVLANWDATNHPADLNHNGVVDFPDLTVVLANFGSCAADVVLKQSASFRLAEAGERWVSIADEDGFQGPATPWLGQVHPKDDLPLLWVSILADPAHPDVVSLEVAHWAHMSLVYAIEENPDTVAMAPQTLIASVVCGIPVYKERDRIDGIVLTQLTDDGDPNSITYASSLAKPIVLVDRPLVKTDYPQLFLLYALRKNYIFALPSP